MSTQNITSLYGLSYEAIHSQNVFSYLKMFSMQCKTSITVEETKKRMNITNFTYIYIYIYINPLRSRYCTNVQSFSKIIKNTFFYLFCKYFATISVAYIYIISYRSHFGSLYIYANITGWRKTLKHDSTFHAIDAFIRYSNYSTWFQK